MRCGCEVPGVILLHPYLYTYSLLRGIAFKVFPLSSYAVSPMMLPQLETFLELLLWNSSQCHHHFISAMISLSLKADLIFANSQKLFGAKSGEWGVGVPFQ
jgi:hypothetical protein